MARAAQTDAGRGGTSSGRRGSGGSFGSFSGGAGTRPPAPAPARSTSPKPTPSTPAYLSPSRPRGTGLPSQQQTQLYRQTGQAPVSGGFGGVDGGAGGGGAFDALAAPMEAPQAPTEEDYLAGDAGYQASLAALMKALANYEADDTAQRSRYETDYGEALRNLGYTRDDPKTADIDESKWDWEDQNVASGRAFQNQLNDFASRGMLQSSGYGQAVNDLRRSFNDQLGGINRARTDFLSQRDRDLTGFRDENTASKQSARAEALARRAAQYAL